MATEPPALEGPDLEKSRVLNSSNRSNQEHGDLSAPPEEGEDIEDGSPLDKVKSVNSISSIPNGGLRAWLVVAGSFFLFFNSWCVCPSSCYLSLSFYNMSWYYSLQY